MPYLIPLLYPPTLVVSELVKFKSGCLSYNDNGGHLESSHYTPQGHKLALFPLKGKGTVGHLPYGSLSVVRTTIATTWSFSLLQIQHLW